MKNALGTDLVHEKLIQNNITLNIEIKGENFLLRTRKQEDIESLQENANNKKIQRFLFDTFPYPYSTNDAYQWVQHNKTLDSDQELNLAIDVEGKAVGGIGFIKKEGNNSKTGFIGYRLGETYRGQGIISKAISNFVDFIFDRYDIQRIEASVFMGNDASDKVLIKNGFSLEGILRENIYKDGKIYDEKMYSLLRNEWNKKKPNQDIERMEVKEQDDKIDAKYKEQILFFKKEKTKTTNENNVDTLFMKGIYRNMDILLAHIQNQLFVLLLSKDFNGEIPEKLTLSEEEIKYIKESTYKNGPDGNNIVGYAGSFKQESHYGQYITKEYRGQGFASLLRNVKEYIDGKLQKEYAAKISNILFLIKRGYVPIKYLNKQLGIEEIGVEQINQIRSAFVAYKSGNDILLPYTIQLVYCPEGAQKFISEMGL